jgi:hypothetical protein
MLPSTIATPATWRSPLRSEGKGSHLASTPAAERPHIGIQSPTAAGTPAAKDPFGTG